MAISNRYRSRFNKPAEEVFIDLLNLANRSFLPYGSVAPSQLTALEVGNDIHNEQPNTMVVVQLPGSTPLDPGMTMFYRRQSLAAYIESFDSTVLPAESLVDQDVFLQHLQREFLIQLRSQDCTLTTRPRNADGSQWVVVTPNSDHPVWLDSASVLIGPSSGGDRVVIDQTRDVVNQGQVID